MGKSKSYPDKIFVTLNHLLRMEGLSKGLSFLARKQKVKSVLGGKHASKLRGRGLDFEEVRNYVPGDDIRNIDWKVTARTKVTHSRVFSEEKEKPALIIVDQSQSMFFGSENKTKSVVAAELAALMSFKILKEGDRVGGVVFANNGLDIIFPKRDKRNVFRFFEKIVQRNQELGEEHQLDFEKQLEDSFAKINNIVSHDFLVVVISDFLRYSPKLVKYLSSIAQHNDIIIAKVYDPFEKEIPDLKIIAGNQNKQIVIDGQNKKTSEKFLNTFNDEFSAFEEVMKKHRIPVFMINTIDDIDLQLKSIFNA